MKERPQKMAVGEMAWACQFDMVTKRFVDPTNGRNDMILQTVYDYGGGLMYDITDPDTIMPLDEAEVDAFFANLEGRTLDEFPEVRP